MLGLFCGGRGSELIKENSVSFSLAEPGKGKGEFKKQDRYWPGVAKLLLGIELDLCDIFFIGRGY